MVTTSGKKYLFLSDYDGH
jgi:WD40 repeat protein